MKNLMGKNITIILIVCLIIYIIFSMIVGTSFNIFEWNDNKRYIFIFLITSAVGTYIIELISKKIEKIISKGNLIWILSTVSFSLLFIFLPSQLQWYEILGWEFMLIVGLLLPNMIFYLIHEKNNEEG